MNELLLLFFGLFTALVIDIIWWVKPSLSKFDKLKAHEHYHVALELVILSIIMGHFTNSPFSVVILGAAFGFLLGEWDQLKEIVGKTVKPGHPFAYGSSHFKASSVIGGSLIITIIILYTYLQTITS